MFFLHVHYLEYFTGTLFSSLSINFIIRRLFSKLLCISVETWKKYPKQKTKNKRALMKLQFTTRPKTQKIFIVNLAGKCNLTPNYMTNNNQVKIDRWGLPPHCTNQVQWIGFCYFLTFNCTLGLQYYYNVVFLWKYLNQSSCG